MPEALIYTVVLHPIRQRLGLSLTEYCIADIIYHLQNNPNSKVPDWCYASKETLGNCIGISEQAVHSILHKLLGKGLVEKDGDTKLLRTTAKWYQNVILRETKETLATLKKLESKTKETLVEDTKETLVNNNSIDSNKIRSLTTVLTPSKRSQFSFNKEDYVKVLNSYQTLKGVKVYGPELNPLRQTVKSMFMAGRKPENIISFMKWLALPKKEKKDEWTENWTLGTVKMKIAEWEAGKIGEVYLTPDGKSFRDKDEWINYAHSKGWEVKE